MLDNIRYFILWVIYPLLEQLLLKVTSEFITQMTIKETNRNQ